jgi:oligopeptide transport system permease protein
MSEPTVATTTIIEPLVDTGTQHTVIKPIKPRSLWSDAWHELRRKPLFIISMVIIAILLVIALFPQLFTSVDPNAKDLSRSRAEPSAAAWFGYDVQGQDIYARCIYGTRISLIVGLLATSGTVLLGSFMGIVAGFYGGKADALLSRFADLFFGIPFVLGGIVILTTFRSDTAGASRIVAILVVTLIALSWPVSMRIMRSATVTAKQQDYVKAARGLGAGAKRIIMRHLLPNTLAPVMVYATIAFGSFVGAEATLSYLGIGLREPVVSWGVMISDSRNYIRSSPHLLAFPAAFLTITVLAFVMLGDAVRDALDPKLR